LHSTWAGQRKEEAGDDREVALVCCHPKRRDTGTTTVAFLINTGAAFNINAGLGHDELICSALMAMERSEIESTEATPGVGVDASLVGDEGSHNRAAAVLRGMVQGSAPGPTAALPIEEAGAHGPEPDWQHSKRPQAARGAGAPSTRPSAEL